MHIFLNRREAHFILSLVNRNMPSFIKMKSRYGTGIRYITESLQGVFSVVRLGT